MLDDILTVNCDSKIIKIEKPEVDITFMKPRYPYGRCLNLGPGIRKKNNAVNIIKFDITPDDYANETSNKCGTNSSPGI